MENIQKTNQNEVTLLEEYEEYEPRRGAGKKLRRRFMKSAETLHRNHREFNSMLNLGFILTLVAVIVAAFAVRQFFFEPTLVDGESMQNYLMNRERVAVNKTAYWLKAPQRGDIVICHFPNRTERFVKRVIAFGGETIELRDGYVYINGEKLDESAYASDEWYGNIHLPIRTKGTENGVYTVPEGCVFVMGDNRNNSKDSRSYEVGAIPLEQVLGRVVAVVWPVTDMRCAG